VYGTFTCTNPVFPEAGTLDVIVLTNPSGFEVKNAPTPDGKRTLGVNDFYNCSPNPVKRNGKWHMECGYDSKVPYTTASFMKTRSGSFSFRIGYPVRFMCKKK
ncbi:MAG TPA: hypothetical protein VIN02_00710, partial [Sulfurovum sp.]